MHHPASSPEPTTDRTPPTSRRRTLDLLCRFAWLPIPLLLAAIVALKLVGPRASHESVWLTLLFNFVCSLLVSLLVAYLLARTFLVRCTPGLLALSLGVFLWGIAGPVASSLLNYSIDVTVAVHNSLVWLSACLQLVGAWLLNRFRRTLSGVEIWVVAGYAVVTVLIAMVLRLGLHGEMPNFFVQGQGGTPLRQWTLGTAMGMFVVAAVLLRTAGRESAKSFVRWYSLGLGLYVVGLLGTFLQSSLGSPLNWTARSAQFLGGVYMLISGIVAVREARAWQIPLDQALERERHLLRQSERRYQSLFETMSEGFALHEIVTDQDDHPCDYIFLEANPAFERLTGLERARLIGKRVSEVLPGVEAHWIHAYGRVALTGEPARMENYSSNLGRWYEAFAYRTAPRQFAVVFTDITPRKRIETQLREVAEKYSTLFNASADGIWISNLKGEILEVNDAYCRMSGYSRSELEHMPISRLEAIRSSEDIDAETARLLQLGHDRFESQHRRKNGSVFDVDISVVYYERGEGRVAVFVRDITARKQVEEALRQSENRLRLAQVAAGAGVWDWDLSTGKLEWSDELFRLFGLDPTQSEASFATWQAVTHPDDWVGASERLQKALDEQTPLSNEYRILLPSGRVRWIYALGDATYDSTGAPQRMIGICLDLTDRKRAEDALRESEEKFRNAVAHAAIGFAMTAVDGRFVSANPAYCQLTGYSMEELLNTDFRQLIHPDDLDENMKLMEALASGEIPAFTVENRYVRKGGEPVWVRKSVSLVKKADGEPQWMIALTENITKRKQAEEALRRSRKDLDRAQEVGQIGSWRLDLEKNALTWSDETYRIFGVPKGTPLTYEMFLDIIHPEDRETVDAQWQRALSGESYNIEHRILVNGEVKWLREKAYLEFDETGHSLGGFGITQDITQLKQAEADLKRANEQLEQKVQRRTAELALRAEQLRALAGELTLSEQRERRRLAKVLHDHIQQLLVSAKFRTAILGRSGDDLSRQAAAEIEHLLDATIKSARSLTAELSPPILHEGGLAAGLEWLGRWMADKHGLMVDLSIEDDLPELPEDLNILFFESIRELLFNAVKHAHVPSVSVSVRQIEGRELRVTVSDEGPGFDPAKLQGVGEAGSGFGLFNITERFDMIGGRLDIESAPGQGSRFMLTAPFAPGAPHRGAAPAPQESPAVHFRPPAAPSAKSSPIRVLIADDHMIVRQGLANLLCQEQGIEVVGEVADGQAAVQLAAELMPDVILMDMSMPTLNGVEATRIIAKSQPGIQVIGLSMFEEDERAQAMRDAGAADYLTKSGKSSDLVSAIRRCITKVSPPPARTGSRKKAQKKTRTGTVEPEL